MEGRPEDTPLKVCAHCSVASRTDSETCPSCGRPYVRRGLGWRWSWWFAIPIVAGAFLIGFFGLSELIDGDDSDETGKITLEQGAAVETGITRFELIEALDGREPARVQRSPRGEFDACLQYLILPGEDSVWQFCFKGDELVRSGPPGGRAPVTPAPEGG